MGNYKWNNNTSDKSLPYVVVLFRSRNKDNSHLENFTERKKSFFRTKDTEKILKDFEHFVEDGIPGETSRLYISVNARDVNKVKKELLHTLIDEDDFCFDYLEPKVAGIAASRECAAEKKWLFDFDYPDPMLKDEFINDVKTEMRKSNSDNNEITCYQTIHGYAIICNHGFDTRYLMEKWNKNQEIVTLLRDDLLLFSYKTKMK